MARSMPQVLLTSSRSDWISNQDCRTLAVVMRAMNFSWPAFLFECRGLAVITLLAASWKGSVPY